MPSVTDLLIQAIELQNQHQSDGASRLFTQVLDLEPGNPHALYSLALIAMNTGALDLAAGLCRRGTQATPQFAPLHYLQGAVLQALGDKEAALRSFDAALDLKSDYIEVLLNSGALLRSMFRHQEALERFNRILTLQPEHTAALGNCGILLTEFRQNEQAIAMFERLTTLSPDYDYGLGLLFYERMHICDWKDFSPACARIVAAVHDGKRACKSLAFMSASDDAADHQQAARIFAAHHARRNTRALWVGERYQHKRIRLAYVSPDFREHPVGHLMAGVFEHHDHARFETIAISLGVHDQSRLRARMQAAFDHFIDARALGAAQIAQQMRDLEVDIAIDLGGYTSDTRTDIFALKPAPVQVNYLGYPGTMGTDYYDYILADRHVIPPEHQQFYDEKVVYLPDCYLPTDGSVAITDQAPTRTECGLPQAGFVFCSFSHDYKINPPMFDAWMRLMAQVPGSVLWLMSRGTLAQANLRKEAAVRGVDPIRLVFAGRVPHVEDHLARYRQADLFLDTHPYNAHTTAADALMAGLPVLTCMGNAFPARVAGSLLHTMKMPELVTHSLADYEAVALRLARAPDELAALRQRIRDQRATCTLFDTAGFCQHLEAACTAMWRASQLGAVRDALS